MERTRGPTRTVTPSGVAIAGDFKGTIDFGGSVLTASSGGTDDIFIASFDANGNYIFSKRFGSADHRTAEGIAADAASRPEALPSLAITRASGRTGTLHPPKDVPPPLVSRGVEIEVV